MFLDGMPVNDKNTPTTVPTNEFTQMIELVRARNAGQPVALPPQRIGVPIMGTPLPTARSAEIGIPVDVPFVPADRPLSPEENEALNRAALASGLVRGPVTPGIANTLAGGDEMGPYGSLEDAIREGAPISATEQEIAAGSRAFREPEPPPLPPVRSPRMVAGIVQSQVEAALPKMPDFKKVQMIDLVTGKCYVDSVSFDLTPSEVKTLKKFCVTKARDTIQSLLDAALAEDSDGEAV
jgi:hypothetical protein